MNTSRTTDRKRLRRTVRLVAIGCCLLTHTAGCRTGGYRASKLPGEYRVSAKAKETGLNLARMSGAGIGTTQLAAGDLVEVTIVTGKTGEKADPLLTRVATDGSIELPMIGPVSVLNLEPVEAARQIRTAAVERGIYRRPHVTLDIKSQATNKVTVLGAVASPGAYEIPRGASDLAAAIGAAGGLTEEASRQVDILRYGNTALAATETTAEGDVQLASHQPLFGDALPSGTARQRIARVDLQVASAGADERRLYDRDVVMVLPREKEVIHVTGLVTSPGQFELPFDQDVHLLDAIALAGGLRNPVADRVLVIRRLPDRSEPVLIRASVERAKKDNAENIRLATGDTVSIERTPATVIVDIFNQVFRMSVGLSSRATVF